MLHKSDILETVKKMGFEMMLAMIGGFMDVYSYTVRGGVFTTGQTGNFVLMGVHLVQKDYLQMFKAAVPIVSFWIGTFIACHMLYYFKEKQLLWKRGILVIEIFILFIVGMIPSSYPDIIANTFVSFAASLQFFAFRKFGSGENYSSVFCTGNMRSCAENYYKAIVKKDKQSMKIALGYTCILSSFFIGAVSGAFESELLHEKAIWSVSIVLLVALVLSFMMNVGTLKNTGIIKDPIKEQM